MVPDDLLRRILWLHGHGQVIVAYRPHSVPFEGLAGYFTVGVKHLQIEDCNMF